MAKENDGVIVGVAVGVTLIVLLAALRGWKEMKEKKEEQRREAEEEDSIDRAMMRSMWEIDRILAEKPCHWEGQDTVQYLVRWRDGPAVRPNSWCPQPWFWTDSKAKKAFHAWRVHHPIPANKYKAATNDGHSHRKKSNGPTHGNGAMGKHAEKQRMKNGSATMSKQVGHGDNETNSGSRVVPFNPGSGEPNALEGVVGTSDSQDLESGSLRRQPSVIGSEGPQPSETESGTNRRLFGVSVDGENMGQLWQEQANASGKFSHHSGLSGSMRKHHAWVMPDPPNSPESHEKFEPDMSIKTRSHTHCQYEMCACRNDPELREIHRQFAEKQRKRLMRRMQEKEKAKQEKEKAKKLAAQERDHSPETHSPRH